MTSAQLDRAVTAGEPYDCAKLVEGPARTATSTSPRATRAAGCALARQLVSPIEPSSDDDD
jgi:hypothetical protein